MSVGSVLREIRQERGLSLRAAASKLGVDPAYLSRVEAGKVPPSESLVECAAREFQLDPDELLLLSGRVPPSWQETIASAPREATENLRAALAGGIAEAHAAYRPTPVAFEGQRAIEDPAFPFEELSDIAELESWRKEIYRPVYHLHKWWAQRLGSVFRAILLGAFAPRGSSIIDMFYQPVRLPGAVVFDPFMGSGTTLGEALKLGARAIGRDINPVAHFAVRNALRSKPRQKILETFQSIAADVTPAIRYYYQARAEDEHFLDVLYYFWVKWVPCPRCGDRVDLFNSYVFAQNAIVAKNPEARALCPACGAINAIRYDETRAHCHRCAATFDPQTGPAKSARAECPHCGHLFTIVKRVQELGRPPDHRLYAKMVLRPDGSKDYLEADDYDHVLYEEARQALLERSRPYPVVEIEPGYNTNQVLNYCYRYWHQMFNDRQLLCLAILADRIREIPDEGMRELFTCLFSGTLEFNNMFASFKGEGTGAVRHMFSHHILKPERAPLEANLWGTPRSSGSFSTLFEGRILRALEYMEHPFELRVAHRNGRVSGEKVFGLSAPLGHAIAKNFGEFDRGQQLYLSCGDSSVTDLPDESVDAVITDPPFFDNVHYSQLADFFYVWQRHILGSNGCHSRETTRSGREVQQEDPAEFAARLGAVFRECGRVLRPDGLLVFTYHHSRAEGWQAVLGALAESGFIIVATHPVKAEMSVAAPKRQASEPIDLDIIIVGRKLSSVRRMRVSAKDVLPTAVVKAADQVARLNGMGRRLSRNDVRVVLTAQVIAALSRFGRDPDVREYLDREASAIESAIQELFLSQDLSSRRARSAGEQMKLF